MPSRTPPAAPTRSNGRPGRRSLPASVAIALLLAGCAAAPGSEANAPVSSSMTATAAPEVTSSAVDGTPVGVTGSSSAPGAETASSGGAASSGAVSSGAAVSSGEEEDLPRAIVSLSPSLTEMLFAIGAGDQVVAVDTYSDYPPSVPHSDIDAYHLNIEALTAYEPDLVVAARMSPEEEAQLTTLGIPVLSEPAAATVDDTYAQIEALGAATGHEAEADALVASMREQIEQIVASVTPPAEPRTYYYELSQKLSSATSETFIGQLLGLLGLRSIADAVASTAKTPGYPRLSAEYIIDAQPDYIFLSEVNRYPEAADVASRPGWAQLPAVRDGRVIVIDDDLATRWGPRIVDLLREVAQAIADHPAP